MLNKKTIDDLDLYNKRVVIRVDFNVPINSDGVITNNKRIVDSLPTINKALESNCKIILLSHLGRVESIRDKEKYSLKPVCNELSRLLKKDVIFLPHTSGKEVKEAARALENGQIMMLENTRFEDLNNKAESSNNEGLGRFWASLADVFINDAFASAHRKHASNYGIAKYVVENALGYLYEKEVNSILKIINRPHHPVISIVGGSKVSDKLKLIESLLLRSNRIIIAGGMAHTFWKAQGLSLGITPYEEKQVKLATELLKRYQERIVLPVDSALSPRFENIEPIYNKYNSLEIPSKLMAMDIGPKSLNVFRNVLKDAKTIIWNGPVGVYEFGYYSYGTRELAKIVGDIKAIKLVGGGDSVAAIEAQGLTKRFTHVSTGGGACLKLIEDQDLITLRVIQNKDDKPRQIKTM